MSRTYEIACHDCEEKLWIGQGVNLARTYIYKTDEQLKALEEFLFSHLNHRLEFSDSEFFADDTSDYKSLDSEIEESE